MKRRKTQTYTKYRYYLKPSVKDIKNENKDEEGYYIEVGHGKYNAMKKGSANTWVDGNWSTDGKTCRRRNLKTMCTHVVKCSYIVYEELNNKEAVGSP